MKRKRRTNLMTHPNKRGNLTEEIVTEEVDSLFSVPKNTGREADEANDEQEAVQQEPNAPLTGKKESLSGQCTKCFRKNPMRKMHRNAKLCRTVRQPQERKQHAMR